MSKKIIIDKDNKPPKKYDTAFGFERGKDPWHKDAFPEKFSGTGSTGERRGGWFLLDAWDNQIEFIADGIYSEDKHGLIRIGDCNAKGA